MLVPRRRTCELSEAVRCLLPGAASERVAGSAGGGSDTDGRAMLTGGGTIVAGGGMLVGKSPSPS